MGGSLTAESQFALIFERAGGVRISRFSGPVALYDASVAARTFEDVNIALANPRVFGESAAWNITRSVGYFEIK